MGLFSWILIGILTAWLANALVDGYGDRLPVNLAVGTIGAIVGGFLFVNLSIALRPSYFGSLITAIVGAVIFLVIGRAISRLINTGP